MIFASAPTPAGHCLDHTGTPAAGVFGGGGKPRPVSGKALL